MAHKTKSGHQSDAWKNFERDFADLLRAYGLPAFRVSRGDDLGESDTDVKIEGLEDIVQIDCKYRVGGLAIHSIAKECEKKYVGKDPKKFLILPTKSGGETGSFCTLRSEVLVELLAYRYLSKHDHALVCPYCQGPARAEATALDLSSCVCETCSKGFMVKTKDLPKPVTSRTKRKPSVA